MACAMTPHDPMEEEGVGGTRLQWEAWFGGLVWGLLAGGFAGWFARGWWG
jgi:hypothetical protein